MSKAKQNTFLTGYFAILGVGALGLGYLAWSSSFAADDAKTKFDSTKQKLTALRSTKIFPNQENVDKKRGLVDAFVAKSAELSAALETYQRPLADSLSNADFQAKLISARDRIVGEAMNRKITLPENFSLGMDDLISKYPAAETVPRLNAWLEGMESLADIILSSGVSSIDAFSRRPLPFEKVAEEQKDPKDTKSAKPPAKPPAKPAAKPASSDVAAAAGKSGPAFPESVTLERYPITVSVTGSSRSINAVLSTLANTQGVLYNIKNLRIENELKEGPDKAFQVKLREEVVEGETPIRHDAEYILGNEKIKAFFDIDLVRFLAPKAPDTSVEKK